MYSDQSSTSTEIRNLVSSHTTVPNVTNSCYTMSLTLDGKHKTIQADLWLLAAPCQHRLWTECYHPDIHNTRGLDHLLQNQHKVWTETTILPYIMQEDSTACSNINTVYGRKRPSWHTKYKRTCDRLLQYKLPNFAWNYQTKVGATTWTLNTKG